MQKEKIARQNIDVEIKLKSSLVPDNEFKVLVLQGSSNERKILKREGWGNWIIGKI